MIASCGGNHQQLVCRVMPKILGMLAVLAATAATGMPDLDNERLLHMQHTWRKDLLENVMPFWLRYSLDEEVNTKADRVDGRTNFRGAPWQFRYPCALVRCRVWRRLLDCA